MTAHKFLMDKGVKSLGELHTASQIEQWLTEYADLLMTQPLPPVLTPSQESVDDFLAAYNEEVQKMMKNVRLDIKF